MAKTSGVKFVSCPIKYGTVPDPVRVVIHCSVTAVPPFPSTVTLSTTGDVCKTRCLRINVNYIGSIAAGPQRVFRHLCYNWSGNLNTACRLNNGS
jgi:hypothetical protein